MEDSPQVAQAKLRMAAESNEAIERLKFAIAMVQTGIQSLTLINGGAMIALFTFLGSADKAGVLIRPASLWHAFIGFSAGLVFTLLANLGAFVSQNQFYEVAQHQAWNAEATALGLLDRHDITRAHRFGNLAMNGAIAAAMLALAGFVSGCAAALSGVLV